MILIVWQFEDLDQQRREELEPLMHAGWDTIEKAEKVIDKVFKSEWQIDAENFERQGEEAATRMLDAM
jgi:hypothetical protein